MDALIIQMDVANKKAVFTGSKALGAYTSIGLRCYNFPVTPDAPTMKAVIYSDSGTALSVCGAFAEDDNTEGTYEATMSLATDNAIAFFTGKNPNYQIELALVISDNSNLYCNSKITVKNNPNGIPTSPTPIYTHFIMVSDLGWTSDIGSVAELRDITEQSTAAQVRRALVTLVTDLKSKGVV